MHEQTKVLMTGHRMEVGCTAFLRSLCFTVDSDNAVYDCREHLLTLSKRALYEYSSMASSNTSLHHVYIRCFGDSANPICIEMVKATSSRHSQQHRYSQLAVEIPSLRVQQFPHRLQSVNEKS